MVSEKMVTAYHAGILAMLVGTTALNAVAARCNRNNALGKVNALIVALSVVASVAMLGIIGYDAMV